MISSYFTDSIDTLRQLKRLIAASVVLFFTTSILGALFSEDLYPHIFPILQSILEEIEDANFVEIFAFILGQNLSATAIIMLSGIAFGITPFVSTASNGIVLGVVLAQLQQSTGASHWWEVVPHGIFELPALFIATSLGFYLGGALFAQERWEAVKHRLMKSLTTYTVWVMPLLLIAAIIESTLITSAI
jgi:stage II sporulation protein M